MVAPVPAQISKLRPRLSAAARRGSLSLLTTHHPLPPVFRPSLCFHALTNPSSRKPFIFTSIQIPRGCGGTSLQSPSQLCASLANPLLSCSCSLFVVSLPSFPRSFPLFSIVCSLFSQNTRGGGYHRSSFLGDAGFTGEAF